MACGSDGKTAPDGMSETLTELERKRHAATARALGLSEEYKLTEISVERARQMVAERRELDETGLFQIFVKDLTGRTLTFRVLSYDTTAQLKCMIWAEEGIHPADQRLIFGGRQIEETWKHIGVECDHTLANYNIQSDSTLHLVVRCAGGYGQEIYVRTLLGRTLTFHVLQADTTAELKRLIQAKEGIPSASQRLLFAGKRLEDGLTLGSYSIQPGSTLHVIFEEMKECCICLKAEQVGSLLALVPCGHPCVCADCSAKAAAAAAAAETALADAKDEIRSLQEQLDALQDLSDRQKKAADAAAAKAAAAAAASETALAEAKDKIRTLQAQLDALLNGTVLTCTVLTCASNPVHTYIHDDALRQGIHLTDPANANDSGGPMSAVSYVDSLISSVDSLKSSIGAHIAPPHQTPDSLRPHTLVG
jgi:hypothetical protein